MLPSPLLRITDLSAHFSLRLSMAAALCWEQRCGMPRGARSSLMFCCFANSHPQLRPNRSHLSLTKEPAQPRAETQDSHLLLIKTPLQQSGNCLFVAGYQTESWSYRPVPWVFHTVLYAFSFFFVATQDQGYSWSWMKGGVCDVDPWGQRWSCDT